MNVQPNRAVVPPDVVDAVNHRWPGAESWYRDVEGELQALCKRLDATPVEVFDARYGFVVAVDTPDQQLVLRASADPEAKQHTAVSLALANLGVAPAIHDVIYTGTGTWTIMDRVVPGTPLAEVEVDAWTLPALLSLFRPMLDQPAPDDTLPLVSTWLRQRLLDDHLVDLAPGRTVASRSAREHALSLLNDLGDPVALCHGDASTWNVLRDGSDGFRLIDPRGMNGEVAYDLAVVAIKSVKYTSPRLVAETLARELGIDPDRLAAWMTVADAARV